MLQHIALSRPVSHMCVHRGHHGRGNMGWHPRTAGAKENQWLSLQQIGFL